ncbi:MAG TPA: SDR family oxidoreductase [Gammaproteobacteria bacterium]|nr:SDR family oxidoreductase [Gammaproteobacteria bacterium]
MQLSNQYPSLKGKVVFITGGASGIGAALVEAFCRQGAQVAFIDILENEASRLVKHVASLIGATTPKFYPCNLIDIEKLQHTIAQTGKDLGPISVLVNNAADDTRHDFTTITREYWDERIAVNLRHAFFAIQAAHPQMKQLGGGSIINFGSMSWYECQGGMTGYTTSKGGIEGMTRGLARDLGADRIRINTLVPGWVMTEKQLKYRVDASTQAEIESSQCLKDRLQPEDVAAMTLFLASDDSRMCTAQNFIVDAGWI